MKEYKMVYLNPKMKLTTKSDLEQAEKTLNEYAKEGWILQQVVAPSTLAGTLVAVMYKDTEI